jgi:AraC-like DNA-binding protein
MKGSHVVSVTGPRREPLVRRLPPRSTVVGVRLRPGVPADVIGATATELTDSALNLDELWGRSAVAAAERIALAATPRDAARVLEQELAARCSAAPARDPLVAEIVGRLQPWQRGRVGELTSELFMSPRQLRRRCVAAFGFPPKTLHRILRFQGFLSLAQAFKRHDVSVAWLAATAGYFDQAHLTRDCVGLAGCVPGGDAGELRGQPRSPRVACGGAPGARGEPRCVAGRAQSRWLRPGTPGRKSASYKRRPQRCA